jgi:hypothetical protein
MAYLNFIVVEIVADFISQVLVLAGESGRVGEEGESGRGGKDLTIFDMKSKYTT